MNDDGRWKPGRREAEVETIEIHTEDGRALRADVREPARGRPVGVAVLAHAMFARRTEFERPRGGGLARFLAERGWRTIAFDFRGHGDSAPSASDGGAWSYDDLVLRDLPAVVSCARARAKSAPVVVVGHSLGGHVALASQGAGVLDADAILAIAANVWMRELEPSRALWALKRGALAVVDAVCAKRGYFPARTLRIGSDDEARGYMGALSRFAREGAWTSDDGRHDYGAARAKIRAPVAAIASEGDRLNCRPVCAEKMIAPVAGPRHFESVARAEDGSAPPGHMELVTTASANAAWGRAIDFIAQALPSGGR